MGLVWGIALEETERACWLFEPFVGVGPLRFGMDHDRVAETIGRPTGHTLGRSADFWHVTPQGAHRPATQVKTYYGESGRLCAIAVDALRGPQVAWSGIPLVGSVPSRTEERLMMHAEAAGFDEFIYSPDGVAIEGIGLLMRVQRAGDILLTRPVFVDRVWAERVADPSEGPLPRAEWGVR